MAEIILQDIRIGTDVHMLVTLTDSGVAISWDSVDIQQLFAYSEPQRAFAGNCTYVIDEEDATKLHVTYPAAVQKLLGKMRLVAQVNLLGNVATYDAFAFNIVKFSDDDEDPTVEEIEVPLAVEAVDTTIMYEILRACQAATAAANEAKEGADAAADAATAAAAAANSAAESANTAAAAATTAAESATTAAAGADAAAASASSAAGQATTAAGAAMDAKAAADAAASGANTAAASATSAAAAATTAKEGADTAAAAATAAAASATSAAGTANTAADNANTKAGLANTAAETANAAAAAATEATEEIPATIDAAIDSLFGHSLFDFAISDEQGNSICAFHDGNIETKEFDSKTALQDIEELKEETNSLFGNSSSDFAISDEQGNSICAFHDGNIETKEFDSKTALQDIEELKEETNSLFGNSSSDFAISDEQGNNIALFYGGGIETKEFDSKRITEDIGELEDKIEEITKRPYSSSTVRFTVPVNVNMLKTPEDSASLQDSVSIYNDHGILMLPESYSPLGKPTRLVIACHGAGGGSSDHDSQTEQQTQYKYLVANGFAVMDMNGMPADWVETWWDDCPVPNMKEYVKYNNMGTPLAVECYIKGYQWVIQNYNIATDGVLIAGGSMGGLSSTNLVLSNRIPVLAHAVFAPALDTYNQPFLHPWTPVADPIISKYAISKLYDFDYEDGDWVYSREKVCGFNPIINGMQTFTQSGARRTSEGVYDYSTQELDGEPVVEYKSYPCPLKIWHCDNDPTVSQAVSIRQINAICNAGGIAWLRRFPTGGHGPESAGTPVANPIGNTTYRGSQLGTIYPAAEELLMYFNRFNLNN